MANPFFGRIGDVWKHLILLEVLDVERPDRYVESHAGSAIYPLTHSVDRDFGVFGFLDRVRRSDVLASSRYVQLLSRLPSDGGYPTQYPGSALLAMMLLRRASNYVFFDSEAQSVRSLEDAAHSLRIDDARCVIGDGIGGVDVKLASLSPEDMSRTLVFIDPFEPFERSMVGGLTSIDLARRAAASGAKVVYWYGFDEESDSAWAWQALSDVVDADVPRFFAEIGPPDSQAPSLFEEGMRGCGVVGLNCSLAAKRAATTVGAELVEAYRDLSPAHSDAKGLSYVASR